MRRGVQGITGTIVLALLGIAFVVPMVGPAPPAAGWAGPAPLHVGRAVSCTGRPGVRRRGAGAHALARCVAAGAILWLHADG